MIFTQPGDFKRDFIKRVVGLPGDQVAIKRGVGVFINGKLMSEPNIDKPGYDLTTGWGSAVNAAAVEPGHVLDETRCAPSEWRVSDRRGLS